MLQTFLNPAYFFAGLALISLPIIIHLINRMRFKRIRWAAMEFLLKSQKRNRRRLIIEQLLLLALRCFLIFLAVMLVSRYLGLSFAGFELQNTTHVLLVDDTLSMSDHWREEGETRDVFKTGKDLVVKEIAKNAVQARTAQRLVLIPLSDPNRRPFDQRLNEQTIPDLEKALADLECTALHVDLSKGVEAAKDILDKVPQDKRILHVVSDFRRRDWSEPDAAALNTALENVNRAGVNINLVDAAHPYRNEIQKTPLHHDNLAIVDLRPETRVASRDLPVQFKVAVTNYGASVRKNIRVAVKVNGGERLEGSVNMEIQPGETKEDSFQIAFDQLGFNQVSANLESEEVGLQGDNIRYAVIDVRKQVPVLVVDGDISNAMKPGGDTYHIQTFLTVAKGYQVVPRGVSELEQPTIDQYASIYLLNVRDFSDKALKNLENYVRDGGSVAFFLGERVRPEFYNDKLYKKGNGIFPAPLADRPTPPMSDKELEPDLFDLQLKLFVRDPNHPIFQEIWKPKYQPYFAFLSIKRYYTVPRRQWEFKPGQVEEIVTLPNQKSMREYANQGQLILESLGRLISDPQNAKYKSALEQHQRSIRDTLLGDKPLYELAKELDSLLGKSKEENADEQKVNLAEFWKQSENQKLRGQIDKFREEVQLGDPLIITENYGKGRVIAFLTTAGTAWNDWAGGGAASLTYPPMLVETQRWLTAGGGDTNRIVGSPLSIEVDSSRYEGRMRCFYQPETKENDPAKAGGNQDPNAKDTGLIDKGEISAMELSGDKRGRLQFDFDGAKKPGLYRFELTLRDDKGAVGAQPKTEQRAYVFNVDTVESDLRRAAKEDLEKNGAKLRNPGTGWGSALADRQSDLSESPWFYLIFLVILVIEQALAVHLSFHLKGSEALPAATRPQASAA
ncbi:MAG TPA: BatA domain-containing protein [Gemmataceae bacterium]|jgi:hypothetical protein|nr:BatA domain-containing protein [Gemmataceae bacterium]